MLSKNKIKLIQSLERKKTRDELKLFVAEGDKIISELLRSNLTPMFIATSEKNSAFSLSEQTEIIYTEQAFIEKASLLKNPQNSIAVFKQKDGLVDNALNENELILALDSVQDPGNLGTIIRLANWFGIQQIICSPLTADCYNPKVVQASMGAIGRITIEYTNLEQYLTKANQLDIPIYGTFLDGENIYSQPLNSNGILVMGNEGNGISDEIATLISRRLHIPSFAIDGNNVESLNVSIATAITLSEFRRKSVFP